MQEFVNEIITSLQDNPEAAVLLGGTVAGAGLIKGREAASYLLDETAKAVYDPVNYSTADLDDVEGPIRGYLAKRREKWDKKNFGPTDYQMSED